jgi:hypothetical protein
MLIKTHEINVESYASKDGGFWGVAIVRPLDAVGLPIKGLARKIDAGLHPTAEVAFQVAYWAMLADVGDRLTVGHYRGKPYRKNYWWDIGDTETHTREFSHETR